jgi:CRP-like cAMP-binding protein
MKPDDLTAILTCPLFKGETDPHLAPDIESLPYRMTTIDTGRLLLIRNDPYDDLIIIISGVLEAFQEDRLGHQFIVESLKAPDAVATAILFAPEPRIPVSLRAESPCRLFSISRPSVLKLCSRYTSVLSNLLRDMGAKTAFLAEKLRYQAFASIRQMLAAYLLERFEGGTRDFTVNKEHLAELFGVTRPSLSRVCQDLAIQNIVQMEGRQLIIINPDELSLIAENLSDR